MKQEAIAISTCCWSIATIADHSVLIVESDLNESLSGLGYVKRYFQILASTASTSQTHQQSSVAGQKLSWEQVKYPVLLEEILVVVLMGR